MIAFVKGILDSVSEDKIIVENQNIGFEILVPGSVVSELPQVGNTVKIYTYTYVREDALQLYGFLTKDSMDMFKLLITVNGIEGGTWYFDCHGHRCAPSCDSFG